MFTTALANKPVINRAGFQAIADIAESKVFALQRRATSTLNRHYREFTAMYLDGLTVNAVLAKLTPKWEDDLMEVKAKPALKMAVDGYRIGEALMGKKTAVREMTLIVAAHEAKVISPTEIWSDIDDLIAVHLKPDLASWVEETSKIETTTTAKQIEERVRQAVGYRDVDGHGYTTAQIAKQLVNDGVAGNRARGELMARTTTVWTHNAGAMSSYRDAGFSRSEWMVTFDDATCEYCKPFDGKVTAYSPVISNFWRRVSISVIM